jgi:hypothetical protein
MKLLGDVGHVESCFGPFEDGVSVGARWCLVCANVPYGRKSFWMLPMVLLGDEV